MLTLLTSFACQIRMEVFSFNSFPHLLASAKTEQENLQIIQLVRSMNMKPDEFAAFLRSGALNAAPTATPYHKQEDAADET